MCDVVNAASSESSGGINPVLSQEAEPSGTR